MVYIERRSCASTVLPDCRCTRLTVGKSQGFLTHSRTQEVQSWVQVRGFAVAVTAWQVAQFRRTRSNGRPRRRLLRSRGLLAVRTMHRNKAAVYSFERFQSFGERAFPNAGCVLQNVLFARSTGEEGAAGWCVREGEGERERETRCPMQVF